MLVISISSYSLHTALQFASCTTMEKIEPLFFYHITVIYAFIFISFLLSVSNLNPSNNGPSLCHTVFSHTRFNA